MLFFGFLESVFATTIRETLIAGDGYDTIAPNTFIIGITKFTGDQVITASKAATAGANDAMFYASRNGSSKGYQAPIIYYYVDANVGWFQFDSNNNAFPVTDEETLNKLANLDIYYVNNIEKKLQVAYTGDGINTSLLDDGVEYQDGTLFVNATKEGFEIETETGSKISYVIDDTVSNFIEEISKCFTVNNGLIVDYNASCGGNIVIPKSINGQAITGIAANAFKGKHLSSVIIPNSVVFIGDDAFADNELDSVTVADKYDTSDFTDYSDSAFPSNISINYENDLTKAIHSLPDEYVIDVYSGLNLDEIDTGTLIRNAIIKEINTENYNFHVDSSEVGKYYMIHYFLNNKLNTGECVDHKQGSFDIYFVTDGTENYNIYFEKRLENCTRVVSVNKEFKITYHKTGTVFDKQLVDNSVERIEQVSSNVHDSHADIITNRKNLEDFVDENGFEYLYEPNMQEIIPPSEGEDIGGSWMSGSLFLFKDDILYQVVDKFGVINLSNAYYPSISPDEYENDDLYIDAVLESFEEKTNVTNYSYMSFMQGKRYMSVISGAVKVYYIALFNKDTLEYWSIYKEDVTSDSYDEDGMTKASCFTVDSGKITAYDGSCGANVKIPSSINGTDVTEIGDYVFYQYDLKSLVLPDGLTTIGDGAFMNNQISTLSIPSSVTYIGEMAFRNNQINSLSMDYYLGTIGSGAFTGNQLSDDKAFIYQREYSSELGKTIINDTYINSYAGKNRGNVTVPSQVKQIGNYAFQGLGIESIILPYGISRIGTYAFEGNKLSSMLIPDTVEYLEWGFLLNNRFEGDSCFIYAKDQNGHVDKSTLTTYVTDCSSSNYSNQSERLEIPSSVKKIWKNAFYNGYNVYVDEFIIPYGVLEIGDNAFVNVYFNNHLSLPKSIVSLGVNLFSDMYTSNHENAFLYGRDENGSVDESILMAYIGDSSESQLVLPSGIIEIKDNVFNGRNFMKIVFDNELKIIGKYAFSNMYYLEEIILPSSVKKVNDNAFISDYNVHKISLNDGLEDIGEYAFDIQNSLDEISIPSSVRRIGKYAFNYINTIHIHGKTNLDEYEGGFSLNNYGYDNIDFINE